MFFLRRSEVTKVFDVEFLCVILWKCGVCVERRDVSWLVGFLGTEERIRWIMEDGCDVYGGS